MIVLVERIIVIVYSYKFISGNNIDLEIIIVCGCMTHMLHHNIVVHCIMIIISAIIKKTVRLYCRFINKTDELLNDTADLPH